MKTEILTCLPQGFPWGSELHCFDTVDSTNTLAKTMASQGAPHGAVLIAEQQTGGRGRLGRSFQSPPGCGIYLSVILRPNCAPRELMHLTCGAGVAMCDAVEAAAGLRPGIKWTNDLVFGGRKLGGILTELTLDPGTSLVDSAVVGIGINCCQRPEDFSPELRDMAASLEMVTGKPVSRSLLAARMIQALYRMSENLLTGKAWMMTQYRRDCVTIGQEIALLRGGTTRHGRAVGVDDDGALLVEFTPGIPEAVNSGEVSIRGMYGYT